MFFRLTSIIALTFAVMGAAAVPAAQGTCAICPTTDLSGDALVANSGGTPGVPRFCGYSADATGAAGPQVKCYYGATGIATTSSDALCEPTTSVVTCP